MSKAKLYNPLDKGNLGKSVIDALLAVHEKPLADIPSFAGAGVYAIYYNGNFKPYAQLAKANSRRATVPVYVGKAVPSGARKGGLDDASADSMALYNRLRKHIDSISAAESLVLTDFQCRYLVVDDIWITLGETLLIQRYEPLWNHVVEGFGNNDPGSGRYLGKRSPWDELHPGRAWARKCAPAKLSVAEIQRLVADYMRRLRKGA